MSMLSQEQIETAVEQTLVSWGAEFDVGQKFRCG
jgi:hypothetical protein